MAWGAIVNRRTVLAFVLVVVASVGTAWIAVEQSEDGIRSASRSAAVVLRESQLAGCARSRQDREDSIRGWTQARRARLATAHNPSVPQKERLSAAAAAAVYQEVIIGFRSRIVDCYTAFPPVAG
jgi:hypothetical protein